MLSNNLSEALRTISQQQEGALFVALLAAFQTLLFRYTGQEDLVVGLPVASRNQVEVEGVSNAFVNMLPLRCDLSGNLRFGELLHQVHKVVSEAYAHRDLPFEDLIRELKLEQDLSRNRLVQVIFTLQTTSVSSPRSIDLALSQVEIANGTAQYDVALVMTDTAQGLIGDLQYNTKLFEATTITRMVGHFQTLLEGIVANPEQRLSALPLLTEAELQQLLMERNATQIAYPEDSCLQQLIEDQVERTPDAVAVVFKDTQLTYRELNARANQLAHYLRQLGVGPEVLVGLCMERSLEMVVGLLGILKAGGAYVPLDPSYPAERIAFMLTDAQAPVLITQQNLTEHLPAHHAQIVCLDADMAVLGQQSEENLIPVTTSDNLAYVIYTSGSTGRPKGVQILHRAVVNFLMSMRQQPGLVAEDTLLSITTLSFDIAALELFLPLLLGARFIVASRDVVTNAMGLAEILALSHATVMQATPVTWRMLLAAQWQGNQHLKILCGGEALPSELAQQLLPKGASLCNLYGPTETTIWSTARKIEPEDKVITVGRPIANTQVYLLDAQLQLVPVGIPGELYIGGDGLARGYLHRPELTAERFIPHPFSTEPNARLYKTGDLARYRPDGSLEFLGRLDQQVKLRGYRIELGEIEALLSQHPTVRECLVLLREDGSGDKRLVAYILPAEAEARPPVSELRTHLQAKLPEYMVPAAFVEVQAWPLTPNGKIDRRALPAPERVRPQQGKAFEEPMTAAEHLLADIWSQLLGLDKVGIHDNFFELGGDSILGLRVIARANEMGFRFTLKQLFQYQTIAQLAAEAGLVSNRQAEQDIVTGPVPLTPIQHWFFEQQLPDLHHWNQAVLLEVQHELDPGLLEQALQALLVHHDALRLRFQLIGSQWQQRNSRPGEQITLTTVDLTRVPEAEQGSAMEKAATELHASLNITEGPLIRVALLRLGAAKTSRLLIVIRHLAVDIVSWQILLEDLDTAYQQLRSGQAVQLPAKTTSFKQWAQQLEEYAQSEQLQQEFDYWLSKAWTSIGRFPVDHPTGVNTEDSACTVSVALSAQETQALLQQVPKRYHTQAHDALLTALVLAYSRWTGERSLLIDLEGHGREDIAEGVDLSRTVGWFTAIAPVILDLSDTGGPGESLKAVKEQLRAMPHGGIGYGLLRYLR